MRHLLHIVKHLVNGTSQKNNMTINELLKILRGAKLSNRVYFAFGRCVPTYIASWRGIYAEPALGWEPAGYSGRDNLIYPTVQSLITELEQSINGKEYIGWKGGEYFYHGDEPLHIDNRGAYTNTEITNIEVKEWEVIIHTAYKDI